MSKISFFGLRHLLSSLAVSAGTVSVALQDIMPLMQRAASGRWRLAPADRLDTKEAVRAITAATGRKVSKVVPVSSSDPMPKLDWMTDDAHLKAAQSALTASVWQSLGVILQAHYHDDRKGDFGMRVGLGQQVADVAERFLIAAVCDIFSRGLHLAFRGALDTSLVESLRASLIHYIAFAAAGNTARVAELQPLIHCLTRLIPIGIKRGEPETWLVLVG
jgi:hypothetical protein